MARKVETDMEVEFWTPLPPHRANRLRKVEIWTPPPRANRLGNGKWNFAPPEPTDLECQPPPEIWASQEGDVEKMRVKR